jgi:hypothetical protein
MPIRRGIGRGRVIDGKLLANTDAEFGHETLQKRTLNLSSLNHQKPSTKITTPPAGSMARMCARNHGSRGAADRELNNFSAWSHPYR